MKTRPLPSKEELDQVFRYDPTTGEIFWRPRTPAMFTAGATAKRPREHACNQWNSRWLGRPAACLKDDGYWYTHFNYRTLLVHRLAWKIMTGIDAPELDHIDGDKLNNTWRNLRLGSGANNQKNSPKRHDNTSGHVGVVRRGARWIAQFGANGTTKHIGIFDTFEEAVAARKVVEKSFLVFTPIMGDLKSRRMKCR